MRRFIVLVGIGLLGGGAVRAQEPSYREDLRFVNELRARHDLDLAREYLERLQAGNPPAELKKELPLEFAKVGMEEAGDEPDSGKRLAKYAEVQRQLELFLRANSNHFRRGEATLDLAQVSVLKARTQLSRALVQDSQAARIAEGLKAREMFVQAGEQLKEAAAELDKQIQNAPEGTPQEKAAKKRLENERLRARLSVGLNLFDQAQTYLEEGKGDVLLSRAAKINDAKKVFQEVANSGPTNPVAWEANAWVGRCLQETGEAKKALTKFIQILESARTSPPDVTRDGVRLARYFRLLALRDIPDEKDKTRTIIEDATAWRRAYPGHLKSPEGYGLSYLLAQVYLEQAEAQVKGRPVPAQTRAEYVRRARALLSEIEHTENDFTDRARRLKIVAMKKQGAFTKKLKDLTDFEDCYVRAQYEILQMREGKETDEQRKERVQTVTAVLERGLQLAQKKKLKPSLELNNAHAMLTFYYLNEGKYKEAARVGEEFARGEPRPSNQGATAAVYALQAYSRLTADLKSDEGKQERGPMLELAKFVEKRWPRELAGDMARHQIGLLLLREQNYPEAIKKLSTVTPAYPSYAFAQYQIATAAYEAEKQSLDPIPPEKPGDKPVPYREIALAALRRVPEKALGADPGSNYIYFLAKSQLGWAMLRAKDYAGMEKLAEDQVAKLASHRLAEGDAANKTRQEHFKADADSLKLYALWGLAQKDYTAKKYAEVAPKLDKVVADFNAGKLPALKSSKNTQAGMALLSMDLTANLRLGNIPRTRAVLQALQTLNAEGNPEAGSATVLKQLVPLMRLQLQELRKKGDKEELQKAIGGFTALLNDLVAQQKKMSPKFILLLSQCYDSMDQHDKAADLLSKAAPPAGGAAAEEAQVHRAIQVLLIRELRLSKQTEKAQKVLEEALGPDPKKPNWGARNIDVLKERLYLLIAAEKYAEAAQRANHLLKQLLPKAANDNTMKEHYLEVYYLQALAVFKHAQGRSDEAKKQAEIRTAANLVVQLEKKEDFGSEASKRRFQELLDREPDLKQEYEKLKGNK